MIKACTLAEIATAVANSKHGQKTVIMERWAGVLGVSIRHLQRIMKEYRPGKKKIRADKGVTRHLELNKWVQIVWGVKYCPPSKKRKISTEAALDISVKNRLIPSAAAEIPIGTYDRVAKMLKLNKTTGRWSRFQAKYANLLHQFDVTSSMYLMIDKISNGETILKLHHPHDTPYKNKPVKAGDDRLWIYGCVDDYSGNFYGKYTTAPGESAVDGLEFFQSAWSSKENKNLSFQGVPRFIYLDNGSISKALPVREYMSRCGVTLINGLPYNSQARGKIERVWRSIFQMFELNLYAEVSNWKDFRINLSDLQVRFQNFLVAYNKRPHRFQKNKSRQQMWLESINKRGGIIEISKESLQTVFLKKKRAVRGGFISYENKEFEVIGLDNGPVWVMEGVFNDRLVVEHRKTGEKFETKRFEPLSFGQRLAVVTPKAQELAQNFRENVSSTKPLFSDQETKLENLPVRTKTTVNPANQFAVPEKEKKKIQVGRPLFRNDREKYEYLLKNQNDLGDSDRKFMNDFEKTPLYGQLAAGYKEWQQYNQKQVVK